VPTKVISFPPHQNHFSEESVSAIGFSSPTSVSGFSLSSRILHLLGFKRLHGLVFKMSNKKNHPVWVAYYIICNFYLDFVNRKTSHPLEQ